MKTDPRYCSENIGKVEEYLRSFPISEKGRVFYRGESYSPSDLLKEVEDRSEIGFQYAKEWIDDWLDESP